MTLIKSAVSRNTVLNSIHTGHKPQEKPGVGENRLDPFRLSQCGRFQQHRPDK